MKKVFVLAVTMLMVFVFSMQAHADLELLGQGTSTDGTWNLIYDTDLDITWYDYTRGSISVNDTWQDQMDWASALSVTFGDVTYTDWRLPTTTQPDPSCDSQWDPGGGFPLQGNGLNCTGSEMGHLYNVDGVTYSTPGDFQNLVRNHYWSSTEDATDTSRAWAFSPSSGWQSRSVNKTSSFWYAMAVRPGLAVAPEPISSTLFIVGGATLGFRRFRKKFKK